MTRWKRWSTHAVGVGIVESRRLDLGLDRLQPRDVLVGRVVDEPARHVRLEQRGDLVDVADEVIVDRPHAGAAIAAEEHEAFAAQLLQRLAHRVGAGAVAAAELADLQSRAGGEPSLDDVLADQLVDRGLARWAAGASRPSGPGPGKSPCARFYSVRAFRPRAARKYAVRIHVR